MTEQQQKHQKWVKKRAESSSPFSVDGRDKTWFRHIVYARGLLLTFAAAAAAVYVRNMLTSEFVLPGGEDSLQLLSLYTLLSFPSLLLLSWFIRDIAGVGISGIRHRASSSINWALRKSPLETWLLFLLYSNKLSLALTPTPVWSSLPYHYIIAPRYQHVWYYVIFLFFSLVGRKNVNKL